MKNIEDIIKAIQAGDLEAERQLWIRLYNTWNRPLRTGFSHMELKTIAATADKMLLLPENGSKEEIRRKSFWLCVRGFMFMNHFHNNADYGPEPSTVIKNNERARVLIEKAMSMGSSLAKWLSASYYNGTEPQVIASARLLRQAYFLDDNVHRSFILERCKETFRIWRANFNFPLEAQYYAGMVLYSVGSRSTLLKVMANTKTFLTILAGDQDLTFDNKMTYIKLLIETYPNNIYKLNDDENIELIHKYYQKLLGKKSDDPTVRKLNIQNALEFYKHIPVTSSFRKDACYAIAIHNYSRACEQGLDNRSAFESIKVYLEEGTKLGDEDCCELYKHIMSILINSDESIDADTPLNIIKQKYEETLSQEERRLEQFIVKHQLRDLNYWKDQVTWLGGKKVTFNGTDIKVPYGISVMYEIINDVAKNTNQKLFALSQVPATSNNHNSLSMFNRKTPTKNCYADASELASFEFVSEQQQILK